MANLIDNDAKVIGETIRGYGFPHVIRTSGGRLYTAHINDPGNQLEIHYSDNDGVNWNLDTTFTETGIVTFCLCRSEQDDIFVAFSEDNGDNTFDIRVKKRDHSTGIWSEVRANINQTTTSLTDRVCTVAITYNRFINRLHLAWIYADAGDIYLANEYSDNYGSTWSSGDTTVLYGSADTIYLYCGDTSPIDGKVFWWITRIIGNRGYVYVYTASQIYFSSHAITPTCPEAFSGAVDSSGNYWSFEMDSLTNIRAFKNITVNLNVDVGTCYNGMVALGMDGANNVYVFYVKDADDECYYRKYNALAGTWGTETTLTTGDGLRPSCEQHALASSLTLNVVFYRP